jgi:hypothetical protein
MAWSLKPDRVLGKKMTNSGKSSLLTTLVIGVGQHIENVAEHGKQVLLVE